MEFSSVYHQRRSLLHFKNILCHVLLWDQLIANSFQYLAFFISNLHCIIISISYQFSKSSTQDFLAEALQKLSRTLTLKDLSKLQNDEQSISTALALITIYFLVFILIYIASALRFYIKGSVPPKLNQICAVYAQIHLSIGFWIVSAILMGYLNIENVTPVNDTLLKVFSIGLLFFNYLFAFLFAKFSVDPFMTSNALCCHSANFQIFTFLFKAFAAPLIFLSSDDSMTSHWTFTAISLVVFLIRHFDLMLNFPYYKYIAMKLSIILSSFNLTILSINFFALIWPTTDWVYPEILVIPLVIQFTVIMFKRIALQYLRNKPPQTPIDVIKKLFLITHLSTKVRLTVSEGEDKDINEIRFWSLIKIIEPIQVSQQTPYECYNKNIKKNIEFLLAEAVKRFPNDQKLRILQIYSSLIMDSQNFEISNFYLAKIRKLQDSQNLITLSLFQKLQENMNRFFNDKRKEMLDIQGFLEHEALSNSFTKAVQDNIVCYLDLWDHYLLPETKIRQIYNQSKKIEKSAKSIESLWKRHSDHNKIFASSLYSIYTAYIALLRASPFRSQKIAQKFFQFTREVRQHRHEINKNFSETLLLEPNLLTIHALMNEQDAGKIVKVSPNLPIITGARVEDTIGRNVNTLMPQFIARAHHRILINHIENIFQGKKAKKMYETIETYLLHKAGHLLPCQVYLAFHPYVQETPTYIAFVKLTTTEADKNPIDQIICNNSGHIKGFTLKIGQSLSINHNHKTNLNSICLNWTRVQEAIQKISQSAQKESLVGSFKSVEKGEIEYDIEISPYFFNDKNYYTISFLEEKRKKKPKEEPKEAKESVKTTKTLKTVNNQLIAPPTMSQKKLQVDLSNAFDEAPRTSRGRGPPPPVPTLKGGASKKTKAHFQKIKVQEEPAKSRFFEQNRLTTQLFTSENGFVQTGDSFLVDDNQGKILFSSHRDLLEKSSRHFTSHDDFRLDSTPFWESSSPHQKLESELEKSLSNAKKVPLTNRLFLLMVSALIISGILLITFNNKFSETLLLMDSSGGTMSNSIFRLAEFTDLQGYIRYTWQGTLGIISNDRFAKLGFNVTALDIVFSTIPYLISNIRNSNKAVKSYVDHLNVDLKRQVYDKKVPVYMMQDNGSIQVQKTSNLFDLSTDLISQATEFYTSGLPPNHDNTYMLFVLNNTMNDPLTLGEEEVSILMNDNHIRIDNLILRIFCMMGASIFLIILIFALFSRIVMKFTKQRNQFLSIFSLLDEVSISEHIRIVESFQASLEIAQRDQPIPEINSRSLKVKSKSLKRKNFNLDGINKALYLLYFAVFCFNMIFFLGYPILYGIVKSGTHTLHRKMDFMTQSNINLYNTIFVFNSLYVYVQESDAAYVKNKPIEQALPETFTELGKIQDFIINDLLDPEIGLGNNKQLHDSAVGNLCEIYFVDDPLIMELCPTIGGGMATRGISGLTSYFLACYEAVFANFKASNRTLAAAREALDNSDLINVEAFYPFTYLSYLKIDEIIRQEMTKDFNNLKNQIFRIIMVYFTLNGVFGTLLALKIIRNLKQEVQDWRNIIRHIPYAVANENKYLKTFLQQISKNL